MPDANGRFRGMSVPSKAKWPPDRLCTCAGAPNPAYHAPDCPLRKAVGERDNRGVRW